MQYLRDIEAARAVPASHSKNASPALQRDLGDRPAIVGREGAAPVTLLATDKEEIGARRLAAAPSVETRTSWVAASVVLVIFTFSYGAPLIAPIALKEIQADLGGARSVPALANSLAWLGSGAGAMAFGWTAER